MNCCQTLPTQWGAASPFGEVLCFGWYDGPTEGIIRCSACSRSYSFEMCAWDARLHSRVYLLRELPLGVFDRVVEATEQLGQPHWPIWVPIWSLPAGKSLAGIEKNIDQLLAGAMDAGLLLLTSRIQDRIDAALEIAGLEQIRALPSPKGEDAVFEDWSRSFYGGNS